MIKQGNLVIPLIFAVTPLLRGNSDAINQSNLRNFSAYIINNETLTGLQQCSNRKTKNVPYGSFIPTQESERDANFYNKKRLEIVYRSSAR